MFSVENTLTQKLRQSPIIAGANIADVSMTHLAFLVNVIFPE